MSSKLNIRYGFSKVTFLQLLSRSEYYDLIVMIGDEVSNRDEILSPEFIRHKT